MRLGDNAQVSDGVFRVSTFLPSVLGWGFSVVVDLTEQRN